jgi:hypothetical protein
VLPKIIGQGSVLFGIEALAYLRGHWGVGVNLEMISCSSLLLHRCEWGDDESVTNDPRSINSKMAIKIAYGDPPITSHHLSFHPTFRQSRATHRHHNMSTFSTFKGAAVVALASATLSSARALDKRQSYSFDAVCDASRTPDWNGCRSKL